MKKLKLSDIIQLIIFWTILSMCIVVLSGCEKPPTTMKICDSVVYESPTDHEWVNEKDVFYVWLIEDFEPKCNYHQQSTPADTFRFESQIDWNYSDSLSPGCYVLVKMRNGTKYGIRTKCI